ncbi:MAG: DNA primase, partial [Xanthomonadales bacterium]|nr:DNA primase [Xanthomonadales bacterium]
IEELLGRVDIVEIIERRVPLKKAGREFQARCPFHDEKTPSFTVSPQKQFYHCFGCGAHGSAIGFLMNYEGLEFPDAVEELAGLVGLKVPREASRAPRREPDLYAVLEAAAAFYSDKLKENDGAIEYLKGRGLSGEIAREFGIGFAPASWNALLEQLGGSDKQVALLKRVGMLSEGNKGPYDKFRNRIMFPIHDRRGRVIAFGGRALDEDGPKYLNSPETELFHKGRELYGLYLARRKQGRMDRILVTEGYMDVVALAQYGFRNTVATLGTATTSEQAELLFRAADEVVFCFDGDEAGRKAAWRALEAALPLLREGRQARFLFLPEGEDPDSMVRNSGAEVFAGLVEEAQPLSEFFFDHFTAQVDMNSIDGRARLVELVRPALDRIPQGVFRQMMVERLENLARHRLQGSGSVRSQRPPAPRRRRSEGPRVTPMRLALAHLVQRPSLAASVDRERFTGNGLPGIDILLELVEFCSGRPHMTTAQLLELWRDKPAYSHLQTLATWALPGSEEKQVREFADALTGLELAWLDEHLATMPRISEQDAAQRADFVVLQQERERLKAILAGRDEGA